MTVNVRYFTVTDMKKERKFLKLSPFSKNRWNKGARGVKLDDVPSEKQIRETMGDNLPSVYGINGGILPNHLTPNKENMQL